MDGKNREKNIPNDLLVLHILPYLPTKTLIRFRLVCKTWNTIISTNSQFIKSQLQLSKISFNNHKLIFFNSSLSRTLYYSFDSNDSNSNWKHLNLPDFDSHGIRKRVVCCWDGLILLRVLSYSPNLMSRSKTLEHKFILWNPNMGRFKLFSRSFNFMLVVTCRICYDLVTDSYKVVIVSVTRGGSEVMIYNVKHDDWSSVTCTNYSVVKGRRWRGVVVDGMLHCVCVRRIDKCNVVVYFDFSELEFKEVPLPADFGDDHVDGIGLTVFKGLLCVYYYLPEAETLTVWVKKDSWNELVVVEKPPGIKVLRVMAFTVNGNLVLLMDGKKLVTYNPCDKSYKTLKIHEYASSWSFINHVESLVSPNAMG